MSILTQNLKKQGHQFSNIEVFRGFRNLSCFHVPKYYWNLKPLGQKQKMVSLKPPEV